MGVGPRKKDNDVRTSQGKMVNPKSVGVKTKDGNQSQTVADVGSPNKQYKQTGKKYTGPNYFQPDPNVVKPGKGSLK